MMSAPPSELQQASDRLASRTDTQNFNLKTTGARPVFRKKICSTDQSMVNLSEIDLEPPFELADSVREILTWANPHPNRSMIVMSEHLPAHLNLPIRTYPPDCWLFQVLFLREDCQFILLTLYDGESVDAVSEPALVEQFTARCARVLTLQLLNVCGKDFILLPCTLEKKSFNLESLKEELRQQMNRVADFYSGPSRLKKESYEKLCQAVLILASASDVPFFFDGSDDAGKKLLMGEPDSDRALRKTISQLKGDNATGYTPATISYRETTRMKSVVLEAAKRVSYSQKVVVVSEDAQVAQCVKKLALSAKREYGLDPSWFRCLTAQEAKTEFCNKTSLDTTSSEVTVSIVKSSKPATSGQLPIKPLPIKASPARAARFPGEDERSKMSSPDLAPKHTATSETAPDETCLRKSTHKKRMANCTAAHGHDRMVAKGQESISSESIQDNTTSVETASSLKTEDEPALRGEAKSGEGSVEKDVHELRPWPLLHSMPTCPVPAQTCWGEATSPEEKANSLAPHEAAHDTPTSHADPSKEKPEGVLIVAIDSPDFPDCPKLRLRLKKRGTSSRASKEHTEPVRILLVGKSGSGKSSTANSLMGQEKLFDTGISFSPVTRGGKTKKREFGDVTIEVVETPGIFHFTEKFTNACSPYLNDHPTTRDFDIICFVVRIGRFTEEENHVFRRIKEMYGEDVVRHMVVIFTCGDVISGRGETIENLLATAPDSLKQMMKQCLNRYVVFDNTKPKDKDQVNELLKVVKTLNGGKKYLCPGKNALHFGWNNGIEMDLLQRKQIMPG